MKRLLILGAGTAGTTIANKLRGRMPSDWTMTVIDPAAKHTYQPDLIFVPFGMQKPSRVERQRAGTFAAGIDWVQREVVAIEPDDRRLVFEDGKKMAYDLLVIATGAHVRPDETPGMTGEHWYRDVFDFYTLEGATALRDALANFDGGRIAINVVEMPIKCPVAPLEFAFLADALFTKRGIRDNVELTYVTPLDAAFTKPVAAASFGALLEEKNIKLETEFNTAEVDGDKRVIRSWDEREVGYDMLVTIPVNMGAAVIAASGMGNELDFVPTHQHSLKALDHDNIFVVGDATNLPTSKAGSVAHFQAEILVENLQHAMRGESLIESFDGHANCFIESGFGKAMLIDFNYDVEPLPGAFPLPVVGPMALMKETRRNHWGKLMFRWVYWNMLLPGYRLPVPNQFSMRGKKLVEPVSIPEESQAA